MTAAAAARQQFLELLASCEGRLRAFFMGAVPDAGDRADLFQDTVLILWRNFARYDASRPFLPWAMGVAVRRLKDEGRRLRRRPGLLPDSELERLAEALQCMVPPPSCSGEQEALAACLAALPEESEHLIRRRYHDEAAMEVLCAETGQSMTALYQSLSRLRRRLAECIRRRLHGAHDTETARHL